MAGRAFVGGCCTVADRPDGARVWAPIVEGSDRTGVLAMTIPEATDEALAACEEVGLLAGYLIATQARTTDLYNLYRRRRALSLAASMQWDLLPWGLGSVLQRNAPPTAACESLEPGDSVLFYTDGVIEAHEPGGEMFGVDRLADLVGRHACDQQEPEEIVRQIVRAILEYQTDRLADDATLVLVRWAGPVQI